MPGVEILSSTTIYNTILPDWVGAIAFFMIAVFLMLPIFHTLNARVKEAVVCVILFVGSVILMILTLMPNKNSINHIEYKVTIDDSVSINEFLDKYEILEQEGKIYTIKEKE